MQPMHLPTRDALKAQAKRLRADLTAQGKPITHGKALEMVAHQWGARDWNTLSAQLPDGTTPTWTPGDRVQGHYLGHAFTGAIKAAATRPGGFWNLTVRFDTAIDVVSSQQFSALRQQVNVTLRPDGRSPQKTSDGTPHMQLSHG